nr:uncharacterized protein LOC127329294 [Lolium perenne]
MEALQEEAKHKAEFDERMLALKETKAMKELLAEEKEIMMIPTKDMDEDQLAWWKETKDNSMTRKRLLRQGRGESGGGASTPTKSSTLSPRSPKRRAPPPSRPSSSPIAAIASPVLLSPILARPPLSPRAIPCASASPVLLNSVVPGAAGEDPLRRLLGREADGGVRLQEQRAAQERRRWRRRCQSGAQQRETLRRPPETEVARRGLRSPKIDGGKEQEYGSSPPPNSPIILPWRPAATGDNHFQAHHLHQRRCCCAPGLLSVMPANYLIQKTI